MFDFNIPATTATLLAVGFAALLYSAIFGLKNFRLILNRIKTRPAPGTTDRLPKTSVIVYAHKSEAIIRTYLESLLNQDYSDFEIIVANDYVKDDMTQEIVEDLCKTYPNLHITYVPQDSRNVSRKKLALTLGIKSAQGDVIVTTAANCIIKSPQWLKSIMHHFCNQEIDIVLGYSHTDKNVQKGFGRWYRSFDFLSSAVQWLGNAFDGKAYRGDSFNLAYRKSVFFNNKGFAKTIHLQNGEDDLYINQIANQKNTAVEISEGSQLTVDWGDNEARMWLDMKERYAFTAKYLQTKAFLWQRSYDISLWIGLSTLISATLTALPNLFPATFSLVLTIGYFAYLIYLYRQSAKPLNCIKLFWSLPIFILLKPIIDWCYKLRFNTRKSNNFTWQRQKLK